MKYSSTNRFDDFEFHDSKISLVSWENNRLIVSAKHLNVHKDAAPNNTSTDMEIAEACVTFCGFKIKEFKPSGKCQTNRNNSSYPGDPLIIHTDSVAHNMFESELRNSITVTEIVLSNGFYELNAIGIESYFSVRFTFSEIEIEWDDYSKKAWYELHKSYKKKLTLATENGNVMLDAHIICHDEDVYSYNDNASSVSVRVKYGEKEIYGYGKDYLWADAFAAVQKKLPNNVKLQCCLTCRHGNMCPVGNKPGELFCTKDVTVTQKSDLFFYTEDDNERAKRSRDYTECCENYQEQSDDFFTYNDYSLYIK